MNKYGIKKAKPAAPMRIPEPKEEEFKPEVESDEEDESIRNKEHIEGNQKPSQEEGSSSSKEIRLSSNTQKHPTEKEHDSDSEVIQKVEASLKEKELKDPDKVKLDSKQVEEFLSSDIDKVEVVIEPVAEPDQIDSSEILSKSIESSRTETPSESKETQEKSLPRKPASKHKKNKKSRGNRMEVDIDDIDERDDQYVGWVPPKNQSGDGMSSLNDKYGY